MSIATAQGKAIITGFCCVKENLGPPEGPSKEVREFTPVIDRGVHLNAVEAFDSVLFVKGQADIPIPHHEPSFMEVESIPQKLFF